MSLLMFMACGEMVIPVSGDDGHSADTEVADTTAAEVPALCEGADYCMAVSGRVQWGMGEGAEAFDATFAITGTPHTSDEMLVLDPTTPGNVTVALAFEGDTATGFNRWYRGIADHPAGPAWRARGSSPRTRRSETRRG